jgi:hypothetical protein
MLCMLGAVYFHTKRRRIPPLHHDTSTASHCNDAPAEVLPLTPCCLARLDGNCILLGPSQNTHNCRTRRPCRTLLYTYSAQKRPRHSHACLKHNMSSRVLLQPSE